MPMHQQIQGCIQQCMSTANQLRGLANQAPDTSIRDTLTEGAHHVELCIKECEFASQRVQQQAGQWQPTQQYTQPQFQPYGGQQGQYGGQSGYQSSFQYTPYRQH